MSDKLKKFYASMNWKILFDMILVGIDYRVDVMVDKLVVTAHAKDKAKINTAFENALSV